jgi:type I restriction enzyme S subunit
MTIERVRVGEVLRLTRREVTIEPTTEYSLVGVYSFGKGIFHRAPKLGAELGDYRFFAIEPGDLVLSNIQAWEGAIGRATAADAGTVGTHRFLSCVSVDDRIDTNWARWFFLSDAGMQLIRQAAPGTTIRNRTLAIDRFEALEIPLPPIDEQRRVADRLDDVAACAARAAEHLGHQDRDHLVALLPGLVDAVLEAEAIRLATVGEVADFIADTVHPGDEPSPADAFIGLQHVESHTGRCLGSDELGPMKGRKFRFRPGDVLYGYLRPYLNKVLVADRHGLCSVDQYVLRPRAGINADLLAYSLRGRQVLNQAIALTHSLQLPRLRSGLLASLSAPVAFHRDDASVIAQLDHLRDLLIATADKRQHQQDLAAALIPAAMNGAFYALS